MSTAARIMEGTRPPAHGQSGSKLGGVAAILIGTLNVIIVIYVVTATGAQRYETEESIKYFAENPLGLSVAWIIFAVSAVLAYAVIPAVGDLVKDENKDWIRAATLYGLVGYTVMGVWAITLTRTAPDLASKFLSGDTMTRKAVLAIWLPEIDPDGWFSFGGVGTWLIVTNVLAWRGKRWPRLLTAIGVVLGIGAWSTVIAAASNFEPLNLFAASVGALFFPIWFVWMGIRLIRAASTSPGLVS